MTASGGHTIRRREFLGLGVLGTLALAGCTGAPSAGPTAAAAGGVASMRPRPALPAADFVLQDTFLIAHRGSGDNWPEHTLEAYTRSVEAGAQAVEISVCSTRDGVLVCHHDKNTERMTGVGLEIADQDFARLSVLRNLSAEWTGPGTRPQPIPRLTDVLDALDDEVVILIEDKQGSNTTRLLDLLDSYPDSTRRFIWKQAAVAPDPTEAVRRGYTTWGYFISNEDDAFARLADRFDVLGIYHGATDDEIRALVGYGKPVICWEVHTRWMRDRVLDLGVRGLMCSNFPYVASDLPAPASAVTVGAGVRPAGDLPWILSPTFQPQLLTAENAVRFAVDANAGYITGSLCPVDGSDLRLDVGIRWPEAPSSPYDSAGFAFGLESDVPYRASIPRSEGGYHVLLNAAGELSLTRKSPVPEGSEKDESLVLASMNTAPPVVGAWTTVSVRMTPRGIRVGRQGEQGSIEVEDSTYRGGYLGLCKNYGSPVPVDLRMAVA